MAGSRRRRYAVAGLLAAVPLVFASSTAWAEESIILDFVRHGQSLANADGTIDTVPPGTELTDVGQQQAAVLGDLLSQNAPFAGVYASDEIRAQDTAIDALGLNPQLLPQLDEIDAGIYEGQPVNSLEGILYLLAPIAWTLGAEFVPIPGSTDANGIAFDERFSDAVQMIYGSTAAADGNTPTDVAFSSEGAIATWTMMNVNNPDFSAVLTTLLDTGQLLPNTGQVVVEGDPGDWTLVSYDGIAVPQDPGLPTELFVDARNLIEAPQFATYDIYEALLTGNATTVTSAIDAGLNHVMAATEQFPVAVIGDIVNALGGDFSSAAANLVLGSI
jgi:broad specificity phosphatase PhoE